MPLTVIDGRWERRIAAVIDIGITTLHAQHERVRAGTVVGGHYFAFVCLRGIDPEADRNVGAGDVVHHTVNGDISLVRVNKAIPIYYDVYTGDIDVSEDKGTQILMVGTGHAAGTVNNSSYTWSNTTPRVRRWGTNKLDNDEDDIVGTYTTDGIEAAFNLTTNTTAYEAGAADHDSGGHRMPRR